MEKINLTYRVRNEVLKRVKERAFRNNCLLNHDIEGKTEGRIKVMGRRGRRRKLLPDNLKKKRE
jgi:hypothetical protein